MGIPLAEESSPLLIRRLERLGRLHARLRSDAWAGCEVEEGLVSTMRLIDAVLLDRYAASWMATDWHRRIAALDAAQMSARQRRFTVDGTIMTDVDTAPPPVTPAA